MYGFEYTQVRTDEELSLNLKKFFKVSKSPRLLEVFTPRLKNDEVLLNYFNAIK